MVVEGMRAACVSQAERRGQQSLQLQLTAAWASRGPLRSNHMICGSKLRMQMWGVGQNWGWNPGMLYH